MSASSLGLNILRHVLPWVSAASIALGAMVALPNAATASFVNGLTYQGEHSCSGPAMRLVDCGADRSEARGQTGTVTGTVLLLACGGPPPLGPPRPCVFRPVAGAQVELDAGGRTAKSAITDADGRYSARVTAGIYTVRIALPLSLALLGAPQTVNVRPRELVEADFRLTFQAA
jgi:hypothetical protein